MYEGRGLAETRPPRRSTDLKFEHVNTNFAFTYSFLAKGEGSVGLLQLWDSCKRTRDVL